MLISASETMAAKKELLQYAALPFRIEEGQPKVLMVTSRETRKWILPKGRPEKKMAPDRVAAVEAYEEAGVRGRVVGEAFATFVSSKRLANGREVPCTIRVFLLEVEQELAKWPEMKERERRWTTPGEAALLASEPGLVEVMLAFSSRWG